MELLMLVVLVVMVLMGIGFGIGWVCRSVSGRTRKSAAEATAPAVLAAALARAYNDGYSAAMQAARPAVPATVPMPAPASAPAEYPRSLRISTTPVPAAAPTAASAAPPLPAPPSAIPRQPTQPAPAQPPTPEELAAAEARKRRRDLRNINITLYAACLLLVAAASLFIGLAIPETARFAGVVLVAGSFYAGGLVVHARSHRLRPAAVAFTGTGLAMIPVVGLALHNFVLADAPLAWLVTSVAGTAAFAYAAARLDSRVVAYLSMTFLLSTALASGASLRSGILWYFLFTVLMATAVSLLAMRRPSWLSNIYLDAFIRSHRFLVPATAAVAVLTALELGGWQFSILFLAFSCYYAALFLQARGRERLVSSYGFRITATIGLTVLAYKVSDDTAAALQVLALLLLLQAGAVLALRRHYSALDGSRFLVRDIFVLLTGQVIAGLAAGLSTVGWLPEGSTSQARFTVTAALVLLTFMAAAWKIAAVPEGAPAAVALLGLLPRMNGSDAGTLWPAVVLGMALTLWYLVRAARSSGPAREGFVLGTRGAAAALVPVAVMAVLEAEGAGGREAWTWSLAAAAAAVMLNQLVSVFLLKRTPAETTTGGPAGGKGPAGLEAPVMGGAAVLAAVLTVWLRLAEHPQHTAVLWVLFAALTVNVLTTLTLRRFFHLQPWLEWVAPAGFGAAGLIGADLLGIRGYEVLTAAGLAYCVLMAGWAPVRYRAGYLLAGQVLLTALVALVVADLDLSVHAVFVAMAVSVAVQQVVRTFLPGRPDGAGPAGPSRLPMIAQWGSAGVLTVLPLAYAVAAGGDVRRHVVVVSLALLLGLALTMFARSRQGEILYPAVFALGMLPLVLTSVLGFSSAGSPGRGLSGGQAPLSLTAAGVVLLVLAVAALAGETRRTAGPGIRNPLLAGAVLYFALALLLTGADGSQLLAGIAVLLLAAGFLVVSRTRQQPWLVAATVGSATAAAFILHGWLLQDVLMMRPHPAAASLWPGFAAALVLYAAGYVLSVRPQEAGMMLRRRILAAGAALVAAAAGISAMPYEHISAVYGSVVLLAAVAAAVQEFPPAWREPAGEAAAVVAALSLQRILWYAIGGTTQYWFLQYWVVILAILAAYEFRRRRELRGTVVLSAAAALLSGTGLGTVVSADAAEQAWALLAHAGLLAFGVLAGKRLFTAWGAAGVAFAVLWFLRGYTIVLLALLAAALIALAVWRLTRVRVDAGEAGS